MRRSHGAPHRLYICTKLHTEGPCPAPTSVTARRIEPYVEALFFRLLENPPPVLRFNREVAERRRRQLRIAELSLAAYRDDERILDVLGGDAFVAGLQVRTRRVDDARRELACAEDAIGAAPIPPLDELRASWPDLSVDERRKYLSRAIDCVFVRPGRRPLEERVHLCVRGDAPDDLPRRAGWTRRRMRPFDPPERPGWWREHWQPNIRWTGDRIEAELRDLIGDGDTWPTAVDFHRHGKTALMDAIYAHGGPAMWARRMGVRRCTTPVSRALPS